MQYANKILWKISYNDRIEYCVAYTVDEAIKLCGIKIEELCRDWDIRGLNESNNS